MNIMIYPDVCICRHVMTYIYTNTDIVHISTYSECIMHFCWDIQPRIGPPSLQMQSHPWWSGAVSLGVLATTMRLRRYKMCREPKGWAWFEAGIVVGLVKISDDFSGHFGRTSAKHGFGSSSFRIKWPFHDMWHPREDSGSCLSTWQPQVCHWDADVVEIGSLPFFCKWNWHLNGSMFWTWDLLRPQSPVLHSFATPG